MFSVKTILVDYSVESDFKALKLYTILSWIPASCFCIEMDIRKKEYWKINSIFNFFIDSVDTTWTVLEKKLQSSPFSFTLSGMIIKIRIQRKLGTICCTLYVQSNSHVILGPTISTPFWFKTRLLYASYNLQLVFRFHDIEKILLKTIWANYSGFVYDIIFVQN